MILINLSGRWSGIDEFLCKLSRFIQVGVVDQLKEVGPAIVFDISSELFLCGFVIRFRGELYAYSNRCPHRDSRLDWVEGEFFDEDDRFLVCATHGAVFEPATGKCVAGPCIGQVLASLPVVLEGSRIFVQLQHKSETG